MKGMSSDGHIKILAIQPEADNPSSSTTLYCGDLRSVTEIIVKAIGGLSET